MSRHQSDVATPLKRPQVATSKRGRDTVSPAKPQARLHPMSRHRFHVATSKTTNLCRDIKFMSRHQFPTGQVATSVSCRDILKTNLCRDIVFMSRPPRLMSMSRHQIYVATSNPCRDIQPNLATAAHVAAHVATSSLLSPFLLHRDAMSRPPLQTPMSRPQT